MVRSMRGEQIRPGSAWSRAPVRLHRSRHFRARARQDFRLAWVYVGHESQVKNPGDFLATRIGRRPLLLVRDAAGKIQLLHNQCAHRGSLVVASEQGHSSEFRCCYHGWTYHLDGRLKAAPLLHGYPPDFDPKDPNVAMRRVPRVASYRGFVFGSLAEEGLSLENFLGHMTTSFDDMVDRAPDDALEVAGGVFKHTTRATGSSISKTSATRRIRFSFINRRSMPRNSSPTTSIRTARAK